MHRETRSWCGMLQLPINSMIWQFPNIYPSTGRHPSSVEAVVPLHGFDSRPNHGEHKPCYQEQGDNPQNIIWKLLQQLSPTSSLGLRH